MARLVARLGITRYEADEHYRIALDFYKKKNLEEAIHNINAAINLYQRRAEYHAARGYFRLEDGLDPQAQVDFEQALALNPYEVLANYGLGVIAYNRQEYDSAHDYFIKAWAADNQRPETLYYLALTDHRRRNNQQAKTWMEQAHERYQTLAEQDREARKRLKNAERWLKAFDKLIAAAEKQAQRTNDAS